MKLLIIQSVIPHYRVPLFNKLASYYDLTVAAETLTSQQHDFKEQQIELKKIGGFFKIKNLIALQLDSYDKVIFMSNIRWLDLLILSLKKKKYIFAVWGIGVSSDDGFDKKTYLDPIRYWVSRRADATIFYSEYPIEKYVNKGRVAREKIFVANNTLDLSPKYFDTEKRHFIFVGTLKKYKKINLLVDIYHKALAQYPKLPKLIIIGDGEYMSALQQQVKMLQLEDKVELTGRISEPVKLEPYYKHAIASISPYQAGLSVLQSFSMGVPFVAYENAITGGELFNIKHAYNGYLLQDESSFINSLLQLSEDTALVKKMGYNAHQYFKENCTIEGMVDSFRAALKDKTN